MSRKRFANLWNCAQNPPFLKLPHCAFLHGFLFRHELCLFAADTTRLRTSSASIRFRYPAQLFCRYENHIYIVFWYILLVFTILSIFYHCSLSCLFAAFRLVFFPFYLCCRRLFPRGQACSAPRLLPLVSGIKLSWGQTVYIAFCYSYSFFTILSILL